MKFSGLSCLTIAWLMTSGILSAQSGNPEVRVVGQMRDVMWKGELAGKIDLDTVAGRAHMYGLGPVEYLAGEILILDGRAYRSTVVSEDAMKVEATSALRAPFFGYGLVPSWREATLPDSVQSIAQLERHLDRISEGMTRPFLFKLSGIVERATIHVVNLPKGTTVRSPQEAHQGKQSYVLSREEAEIIGFFSTQHQTIFTHHDTWLHMHLITADRKQMGHLDDIEIGNGTMKLFLPGA
jgi:acetolactate decarboxylase